MVLLRTLVAESLPAHHFRCRGYGGSEENCRFVITKEVAGFNVRAGFNGADAHEFARLGVLCDEEQSGIEILYERQGVEPLGGRHALSRQAYRSTPAAL